jgi:cell division protease FtsH
VTDEGTGPLAIQKPFSEETAALIDDEMKRIVQECLAEAERLLSENRSRLDALAQALLKEDSLDEAAILRVTGLPPKEQHHVVAAAMRAAR